MIKTYRHDELWPEVGPSGIQITNYKTGIFSIISVLSGYETGEKDKIHRQLCLFLPVVYLTKKKVEKFLFCNLYFVICTPLGTALSYGVRKRTAVSPPEMLDFFPPFFEFQNFPCRRIYFRTGFSVL